MILLRDIISSALPVFLMRKITPKRPIVWLVHPRDLRDSMEGAPFLRAFSANRAEKILKRIPAYILSRFHGNNGISGYIIAVPLLPKHFSEEVEFSEMRIRKALKLSKKLGVKRVSLGGMLQSFIEKRGLDKEFGMSFFDGTNLLSCIVAQKIEDSIEKTPKGEDNIKTIGIIGATTKIGKLLTGLVVQMNVDKVILFGKTKAHLEELGAEILDKNPIPSIEISTDLTNLKYCEMSILAAYIKEDNVILKEVKSGSIFMGAVEPISPFVFELEKERGDVEVIRGVVVQTPGVVYENFRPGLPKEHSFVCVTEAMILSGIEEERDALYSENKEEVVQSVERLLKKKNFRVI